MMPVCLALALALQSTPVPLVRPPAPLADTAVVVIVATTDVHGRVRGWDYVRDVAAPGGLARAATVIDSLRARHPDRVVLLDAGDLLQGNMFAHYFAFRDRRRVPPVVDALNALRYDAATPGNHDFDYGLPVLARAARTATFRYVSANVTGGAAGAGGAGRAGGARGTAGARGPADDSLMFAPFVVIPRGDVRVGVTGFTTPGVMVWDRALLTRGRARVRPIAETAPGALARLAGAGVDLKVVVIHSGLDGPSSYDTTNVGAENAAASLAALDAKPDLVIVGHTHREMRDSVVNGVHFVQPGHWAQSLSVVYVTLVGGKREEGGKGGYRVESVRAELVSLATVPEDSAFVRRFAGAHQSVRGWGAAPVAYAATDFRGRLGRAQDTPLYDLINEIQRRRARADLSVTSVFDTGAGLRAGEVRRRDVFGLYPYENTLRAVRVSARQVQELLEHSSRYYRTYEPGRPIINDSVPGYAFDVVSDIGYTIDLTQPVGRRVRLTLRGYPVRPTDSFTLAVNSYRHEGGGGYTMLKGAPVVYDRGESVRDVLLQAIAFEPLRERDYFAFNWSLQPPRARAAAVAAFGPSEPVPPDSLLFRVLAIGDFHGQLLPREWDWSGGRAVGGAAALKAWLDSLDRACGCPTLRLDAGDQMQGTAISALQYGRPAIDVLNAFGLDAAAIGNHEFDWSVDTLRARVAAARYPFLAANITDTTGARPVWARPWVVIERGGQKIGVIGLGHEATPTATAPWNVAALRFGDPVAAVQRAIPQVRAAGATFVIVVAHEGAVCDSAACRGEVVEFARRFDSRELDLIVAGHTHRVVTTTVNGIPVVQAGSSGGAIAVVDLVNTGERREARTRIVTPYSDAVRPDSAVAAAVARHARAVEHLTSRPVARLRSALPRAGGEYGLGRLVADAFRDAARADVALINNSGIRDGLPAGTVTYGRLFQVLPFQNRLRRVTVPGALLLAALEHVVEGAGPSAHVAGLELWYNPAALPGRRITRTRLANGRPIDGSRRYTLVVPDFLAAGGSGYAMLADQPGEDAGVTDIDAVVRYLAGLRSPLTAPSRPRIHAGDR